MTCASVGEIDLLEQLLESMQYAECEWSRLSFSTLIYFECMHICNYIGTGTAWNNETEGNVENIYLLVIYVTRVIYSVSDLSK